MLVYTSNHSKTGAPGSGPEVFRFIYIYTGWPNEIETNVLSLKQSLNFARSLNILVAIDVSTILAI